MRTTTTMGMMVLAGVLGACGGDDEVLARADAAAPDAAAPDAAPLDGPARDAAGAGVVACGSLETTCPLPGQACCDRAASPDTCVASGEACAERRMACDGPEDCAAGQACCRFADRAECVATATCATTVASERMCHLPSDCPDGQMCCGTAPGPQVDVYAVCRTGPCPQ